MLGFGIALLFATSARAQIRAPPTLQGEPSVHGRHGGHSPTRKAFH
jgi:hypothetical protein